MDLTKPLLAGPSADLRRTDLAGAGAIWTPMGGGRSNHIWRIDGPDRCLVCKLYVETGGNLMFPNDPKAEALALRALSQTGLAPELVGEHTGHWGVALFYEYCPGEVGRAKPGEAAALLALLHRTQAPEELRALPGGTAMIDTQVQRMLGGLNQALANDLGSLRPPGRVAPTDRAVFLHGDPVPANIVSGPEAITLIDWQCPAAGDACEDLAVYLSPAMQTLYGSQPLQTHEAEAFLAEYDNDVVVTRYRALAPHFHWRMAVYCHWKAALGSEDYRAAAALELASLAQAVG